jgi:hypothetical protein
MVPDLYSAFRTGLRGIGGARACLLLVGKAFYPGLDLGPDLLVHMHGEQGGKARRLQDKRDRDSWRYTLTILIYSPIEYVF